MTRSTPSFRRSTREEFRRQDVTEIGFFSIWTVPTTCGRPRGLTSERRSDRISLPSTEEEALLVRSNGRVRAILLECGHEFVDAERNPGDWIACRECRPRRVFRSRLNEHTISPWRRILEVIHV